jgi:hypothetical protein
MKLMLLIVILLKLLPMIIKTTPLDGLLVIEPNSFQDERGFFLETYQAERYFEAGILDVFVQDNQSRSIKGVLRGMHFQVDEAAHDKLVTCIKGRVLDVVVDEPGIPADCPHHADQSEDDEYHAPLQPARHGGHHQRRPAEWRPAPTAATSATPCTVSRLNAAR